MGCLWF